MPKGLGGLSPPQYESAIEAGIYAAGIAESQFGNRLIVTGHSLGGGLASAACIAARIEKPNLIMKSTTYNAAGLHKNTAQMAGGTRSTANDVPMRAVHVKDEILNSMQSRSRLVPLLADLLAWGNKSMPAALANPTPSPGRSPGHLEISGQTPVPEWSLLPTLFTFNQQTVGPPMTHLGAILGIASTSRDINSFIRDAVAYIFDQLSEGEILTYPELISLGTHGFFSRDIGPDLLAQFQQAIAGEIDAPAVNIGDTDYINDIAEPFLNALIQDTVTLVELLAFSGDYHTFPPCAYTFLMDPPE